MLIYNLFRHKEESNLYCAVPEDRPVPAFLTDDNWVYANSLEDRKLIVFQRSGENRPSDKEDFLLLQPGSQNGSKVLNV